MLDKDALPTSNQKTINYIYIYKVRKLESIFLGGI